jgi:hypothetical protein
MEGDSQCQVRSKRRSGRPRKSPYRCWVRPGCPCSQGARQPPPVDRLLIRRRRQTLHPISKSFSETKKFPTSPCRHSTSSIRKAPSCRRGPCRSPAADAAVAAVADAAVAVAAVADAVGAAVVAVAPAACPGAPVAGADPKHSKIVPVGDGSGTINFGTVNLLSSPSLRRCPVDRGAAVP